MGAMLLITIGEQSYRAHGALLQAIQEAALDIPRRSRRFAPAARTASSAVGPQQPRRSVAAAPLHV